jgi:hypothetical protein
MTLGRSSSGAIKVKADGAAGLRAVECACCGPTCNFFPSSFSYIYLQYNDSLPNEIYIGGSRIFLNQVVTHVIPNGPNVNRTIWGGITGGTLMTRNGTSYGNTTNGVILELENGNYTWAIYKNGIRSTSNYLIDGITRHDNFPSSYSVNVQQEFASCQNTFIGISNDYDGLVPSPYIIYRDGCNSWSPSFYTTDLFYYRDSTGATSGSKPDWFSEPTVDPDKTCYGYASTTKSFFFNTDFWGNEYSLYGWESYLIGGIRGSAFLKYQFVEYDENNEPFYVTAYTLAAGSFLEYSDPFFLRFNAPIPPALGGIYGVGGTRFTVL